MKLPIPSNAGNFLTTRELLNSQEVLVYLELRRYV